MTLSAFFLATSVRISRLKFAAGLYLAAVLLIYGVVIWRARDLIWKGYPDFTIYYSAAIMLRRGLGPHLYDEATQFKIQREFAPGVLIRAGALPYNHPPFEAWVFAPFSYLHYGAAYTLWNLANVGMLIALPFLLRRYLPALVRFSPLWWIVAMVTFFPFFFTLIQGQDAILLLFLYALVFISLEQKRFLLAGAYLACGLFKFHLVLPLLIFLLVLERLKILWGFLLVSAALGLISLVSVGWQELVYYPRYVLQLEEIMGRGAIMPADMPNLRGILYLIWPHLPKAFILALSAAVFLVAVWRSRGEDNRNLKFAFGIFVTILVSYHTLGYDLSILMLAVLLVANELLSGEPGSRWPVLLMLSGILTLFLSPVLLILLMKYQSLALAGWAVLFATCGIFWQISRRERQHT